MYTDFAAAPGISWDLVEIWQVDERIAPGGSEALNLTHLERVLPEAVTTHAMPVNEPEGKLEEAAARYAATFPKRFDVAHLGLGVDGHTASLVPDDPVLEVRDRDIAITGSYQGARRMTLTYPALSRADLILFLVTGADKREPLSRLLANDPSIPASHVPMKEGVVFADVDAANA